MRLDAYLAKRKISQEAFGGKLNPPVSQGLVSQWINGITRVTLDRAFEIEAITKKQVTARDCAAMFKDAA